MSRLSRLALAKRSVTLLLAGALFIAGISAWGSLQQELLPDIEFPVVTVIAPFPGAGAADVADQVAKPIERAISSVARLKTVQSTSANSVALVVAQFTYGTDVKATVTAIKDGLAGANLPASVEPNVSALNINASPVIIASIAANSSDGLADAAEIARTEILPEVSALEGVSRADVTGGLEDQLLITLDPAKLAKAGVSVAQINGVLTANNLTLPSGQLSADGTRIPVSTIGTLTSAQQIEDLVVGFQTSDARPVRSPAPRPSRRQRLPSPRRRSRSATSARSRSPRSPRPASRGPTATRRSPCRSPRPPTRTPSRSRRRSRPSSTRSAPVTPAR